MNVVTHRTRVFIRTHDDPRVLVMIRNFGKDKALLLPGGGIDDGESPEESMLREVYEELGLTLVNALLYFKYDGNRPLLNPEKMIWPHAATVTNQFDFFVATRLSHDLPRLKEPEKFDRFDWVHPDTIESYAVSHDAVVGDGILLAADLLEFMPHNRPITWDL